VAGGSARAVREDLGHGALDAGRRAEDKGSPPRRWGGRRRERPARDDTMGEVSDLHEYQHPRFARQYERLSAKIDARGALEHRRRLVAGTQGRVVEVGAGNGRMFPHYPPAVTRVLAVEPDDTLRALAARAADTAPVPVEVLAGDADRLPVDDGWADVVVASLVLCSVPDQATALAEIARVLRPGGELRYYEHVRSGKRLTAAIQDLVTPLWTRAVAGCHPNRSTAAAIRAAGFAVEQEETFAFRPLVLTVGTDHILGTARRESAAR
jgi:ubiquinone/menaquinone biosynthesis C-methylase UbiE